MKAERFVQRYDRPERPVWHYLYPFRWMAPAAQRDGRIDARETGLAGTGRPRQPQSPFVQDFLQLSSDDQAQVRRQMTPQARVLLEYHSESGVSLRRPGC